MAEIRVEAAREMAAPPDAVYGAIADYTRRSAWLPDAFQNYQVTKRGTGAGTEFEYDLHAGRRVRHYRMRAAEVVPGTELTESDATSSLSTTWTVQPQSDGSSVQVVTTWQGGSGIGGFMERTFAPRALAGLYEDMLGRLASYLTET
jgi:uncharacterized protein YndB with AHSA1/START domain